MTGPKKFSLAALLDMCGGSTEAIKEALPWHDLRDGGLWLTDRDFGLAGVELATVRWHPRRNSAVPALPVPFTACELAAFFLAGGGTFLYERFDFEALDADLLSKAGHDSSESIVLSDGYRDALSIAAGDAFGLFERALSELGDNADEAREALRETMSFRREADMRFGRDDAEVRRAANWLLSDAHREMSAPDRGGQAAQYARQDLRLKACEDAGLTMPVSEFSRLPVGVAKVAQSLGITRQALSTDLKAALRRREAARKAGNLVHTLTK